MQSDEKFFEDALDLFVNEGWKNFISEVSIAASQISIDSVNTSEELHQAKGKLQILRQVMNYENTVRTLMEQGNEETD